MSDLISSPLMHFISASIFLGLSLDVYVSAIKYRYRSIYFSGLALLISSGVGFISSAYRLLYPII